MHSAAKILIGMILFAAGLYWYVGPILGHFSGDPIFHIRPTYAFAVLFSGLFGMGLIFIGFVMAWIEYEDLKWSKHAKKSASVKK
ncbi:MAG: hypothetical protein HY364_03895 [Candidatus Aenigmarchaeota archaeon]|nr:hypothetical protein [Candidatus Aenigmarchaeota archaeon]